MSQYGAMEQASKNIWGFDPTSIGGCSLWLDGADSNTMFSDAAGTVQSTIGGSVALWRNKSVSGRNIFSTITVPTGAFTGTGGAVTLTLSSNPGVFQGTTVTIAGVVSTGGLTTLRGTYTVTAVSGNNITFPNSTTTASVTTAGTLTIADNNAIGGIISATSVVTTGAVGSTGTISYSVNISASNTIGLGMLVGNSVTTTGISPAAFNVTNAVISSITEVTVGVLYTIVVNATGATGTATSGGLMTFTNTKFPTRTASNLSFSGSQYLALPNPSLLPRGATNTTRFVVCRTNNTTTRQTIFNNGANAGGGGHFLQFNVVTASQSNSYFITNAFPTPFSGTQAISDLHMITGQFNNLIQAGWHNGTPYPSNNNGDTQRLLLSLVNVGSAFSLIGGDIIAPVSPFTANSRYLDGNISEILVYDSALSNTDRQNIEGYLAWKWGLQALLPASHPYNNQIHPFLRNFVPTDIPNCVMWFDGADLTSMFTNVAGTTGATGTGSIIRHWRDKSGSGNNLTNAATGPTLTTSANPRRFDMVFNGTSSFLSKTDVVNNSNTYTKFLVFNRNSTTAPNFQRLFAYGTTTGEQTPNDPTGFHIQSGSSSVITSFTLNKMIPSLSFTIATNTYYVATIVAGPTSISLFLNGALTPTNTMTNMNTNFNATTFRLGTNFIIGNNGYWPGFINEVISYNRQLDVSEYREVEGYLAWKWGIRNSLPTAHPFFIYPTPSSTPIQPELRLYKDTFDPSDLSPSLWLDGSDTTTYTTTNNRITSWVSKGTQSVTMAPPNIPYMIEITSGTTIPTGGSNTVFTMSRSALGIGTMSNVTISIGAGTLSGCTLTGGSPVITFSTTRGIANGASVNAARYSVTIPTSTTTTGGTGTNSFTLSSAPTGSTGTTAAIISGAQAYIGGVPVPNCTFTAGSTGFTTGANITIANGSDVVVQPGPLVSTATRGIGLDLPYTDFSSGGTFKLTAANNAAYVSNAITLTASRVALDGTSIEISSSPSVTLTVNQPIVFDGTGTVIPGTTPIIAGTPYFIRSVSTLAATNINFPTNYITLGATSGGAVISTLTPGTLSGVTATAGAYLFTFTTSIPHRIPSGAPVTLVLDSHTSTATANATGTFFGNIASVPSTTQFTIRLTSATVGAGTGTSQRLVGNVQYGNNSIVSGSLGTDGTTLTLNTAAPHNLQDGCIVQPYFFGPSLPSQWARYEFASVNSGSYTIQASISGNILTTAPGTQGPGIGASISGDGVTAGTYVTGILTFGYPSASGTYQLSANSTIPSFIDLTATHVTPTINTFQGSIAGTTLTVTSGTAPTINMLLSGGSIQANTYITAVLTATTFTVSVNQSLGSTALTGVTAFIGNITSPGIITLTAGTSPLPGTILSGTGITNGTYVLSVSGNIITTSNVQMLADATLRAITSVNFSIDLKIPANHWPILPLGLNNGGTVNTSSYNGEVITVNLNVLNSGFTAGSIILIRQAIGNITAGTYYVASSSGSTFRLSNSRTLSPVLDTGATTSTSLNIPVWQYNFGNQYRFCSFGTTALNPFNYTACSIVHIRNAERIISVSGFTPTLPPPGAGEVVIDNIQNPGIQLTGSGSFAHQNVFGMYTISNSSERTFTISLSELFNAPSSNMSRSSQTYGNSLVTYSGPMANYGFTDFRYGGNGIGGFSFSGNTTTQAVLSYPANGYSLQASGTNLTNSFNTQTSTIMMVTHASTTPLRSPGQASVGSSIISTAVNSGSVGGADTTSGGRDFSFKPMGVAQGLAGILVHKNEYTSSFRPPSVFDTTSGYRIFSMVFNGVAGTVMGDVASNRRSVSIHGWRHDYAVGTFAYNSNFHLASLGVMDGSTSLIPTVMRLGGDTSIYGFGINSQMFCDMGIAELMVFNTPLTLEQRQLVEGYLAQKYACQYILANQSTTVSTTSFIHPYRTSPAIISPSLSLTQIYTQGLAAWFDAANSSTIGFDSSNNVNSWATAGGILSLTLGSTGTNYPTLVQDAQNGLPGVRFTSSGTPLGTSSIYGINRFSTVSTNNEFTIITVYKQPTFTSGQVISNIIGSSNDPRLAAYTNQFSYRNTTTEQTKNYTANVNGQTYVSVYYRRGNTLLVRDNGLADAGSTTSGTNLSIPTSIGSIFGVTLGAYAVTSPTTSPFAGDIYEHIIFRYALTDQSIFQIEGYLAWKWGLQTALPITHPYYKVRP